MEWLTRDDQKMAGYMMDKDGRRNFISTHNSALAMVVRISWKYSKNKRQMVADQYLDHVCTATSGGSTSWRRDLTIVRSEDSPQNVQNNRGRSCLVSTCIIVRLTRVDHEWNDSEISPCLNLWQKPFLNDRFWKKTFIYFCEVYIFSSQNIWFYKWICSFNWFDNYSCMLKWFTSLLYQN
jgi:hypothetical protein